MNRRNDKGLTLIALIIALIILFILTGMTLKAAFDGKILKTSRDSINKANNQIQKQQEQEEQTISSWDEIPGTMIKSNTAQ